MRFVFNDLDEKVVFDIVDKEIKKFGQQLATKNVTLEVTDNCKRWFVKKGYSREFGARQIARLVQDKLKSFFVDEVLFGRLVKGGHAFVDVNNEDIVIDIIDIKE